MRENVPEQRISELEISPLARNLRASARRAPHLHPPPSDITRRSVRFVVYTSGRSSSIAQFVLL